MATGVVSWSQTAATNATADTNVNMAEGMAPSQVNDSCRAIMASVAKWRDDMAGTLLSSGTNTAYTVTSNQVFASLAAMSGQTIAVRFVATNGAAPTLSVDALGAKPITMDSTAAVATGAIRANSIHHVTYDNSIPAFILHNGHSLVEPGRIAPHGQSTAPSGWLLCDGTGYSRTTFADLFANISTSFGSSDGASFKVPDLRALGPVGIDAANSKGQGSITIGSTGGEYSHTITSTEMPVHNHGVTDPQHSHTLGLSSTGTVGGGGNIAFISGTNAGVTAAAATGISIQNAGSGGAHNNVAPFLAVNYVIKT